jgi:hypothetical protein
LSSDARRLIITPFNRLSFATWRKLRCVAIVASGPHGSSCTQAILVSAPLWIPNAFHGLERFVTVWLKRKSTGSRAASASRYADMNRIHTN